MEVLKLAAAIFSIAFAITLVGYAIFVKSPF